LKGFLEILCKRLRGDKLGKSYLMKTIFLSLSIIVLASICSIAQSKPCQPKRHARVPVITNFTYHRARTRLIAAGWQPFQTIIRNTANTDPNIAYGNGLIFWNRGYIEVEACSGTGVAACAFLYEDVYGNRLRVTTEGEEIPKEKARAIVNSYQFVCGRTN
jgi:hypothetical protein